MKTARRFLIPLCLVSLTLTGCATQETPEQRTLRLEERAKHDAARKQAEAVRRGREKGNARLLASIIHELPVDCRGKGFVILPSEKVRERAWIDRVRIRIIENGLIETNLSNADYVVRFTPLQTHTQTRTESKPVWGRTGGGYRSGTATVWTPQGAKIVPYSGYEQSQYGVVGSRNIEHEIIMFSVQVEVLDGPMIRQDKAHQIYEGRCGVASEGADRDRATEAAIDFLLSPFPGKQRDEREDRRMITW